MSRTSLLDPIAVRPVSTAIAAGVPRRALIESLVALACGGALAVWGLASPRTLHAAVVEDGVIETATWIGFLLAAVGILAAATRRDLPAAAGRGGRACAAAWGSLLIVFAGEEISWGQRFVGFETPAPLDALNQQHEFNLHNVAVLQTWKYTLLVTFVAVACVLLPLAARLRPVGRRLLAWRVAVLPPAAVPWFVVALVVLRHLANWVDLAARNDAQELGECLVAAGFARAALRLLREPAPFFPGAGEVAAR